jgi:hypothetical protein
VADSRAQRADSRDPRDLLFPTLVVGLFLGIVAIGCVIGFFVLPAGAWGRPSVGLATLFRWDAFYYLRIAQHGYQWLPNHPTAPSDLAFFPGYALLEAATGHLLGAWPKVVLIFPSLAFGVVSIFAFYQLAHRLLPGPAGQIATVGFAVYPGASFFVNAYPASTMNLLMILMLLALLRGHIWRAALWAGTAAVFGPLAIVMGLAVPMEAVRRGWLKARRRRGQGVDALIRPIGVALAATVLLLTSLVGFMVFQWIRFGTPFAFLRAQQAWGGASPAVRFVRAITLYPLRAYDGSPNPAGPGPYPGTAFEVYIQSIESVVAILLCLALILLSRRLVHWPVTVAGLAVVIAYYWFVGTVEGPVAGFRELYLAIPMFLGLGVLFQRSPWIARILVGVFAILLCSQVALTVAGYLVV